MNEGFDFDLILERVKALNNKLFKGMIDVRNG